MSFLSLWTTRSRSPSFHLEPQAKSLRPGPTTLIVRWWSQAPVFRFALVPSAYERSAFAYLRVQSEQGFVALPFMSITSTTPASSSMPGIFMRVVSFEPGILYGPYLISTRVDLGFAVDRKKGSIVVILGGGAGFMSMSMGISMAVSICSIRKTRTTYEAGRLLCLQTQ